MTDQPTQPTPAHPPEQPIDPANHQHTGEMPAGRRILPPAAPTADAPPTHGKPAFALGMIPTGGFNWNVIAVPVAAALVAILAVFFVASGPNGSSFADSRAEIEALDDLNNASTTGAPQQEVVNGWTSIEYLNLLSAQQEHENKRRDVLLLLMLLSGLVAYTHAHLTRSRAHRPSGPAAGQ